MFERYSKNIGFTLIEIISVLTIISVISLILLSSALSDNTELSKEMDIAKAHLRYARSMALSNDDISWGIRFSGNTYTLFKIKEGIPTDELLPGQNSANYTLPQGISISSITITFDKNGSVSSPDTTVEFSDGNKITIVKNTGFIP